MVGGRIVPVVVILVRREPTATDSSSAFNSGRTGRVCRGMARRARGASRRLLTRLERGAAEVTLALARFCALNIKHAWGGQGAPDCLAAVKHVVAEVLHFQDGGVGPAGRRPVEMGLDDFAHDNVMVTLFDHGSDLAFDRAGRVDEDRRACCALAVGLAAQFPIGDIGRPKEGEREALVFLAEHVESKAFGRLNGLVGAGVRLDADYEQWRRERSLRHPVHRGCRDIAGAVFGGEHIDAIRNHAQHGLFGVGVHGSPRFPVEL